MNEPSFFIGLRNAVVLELTVVAFICLVLQIAC